MKNQIEKATKRPLVMWENGFSAVAIGPDAKTPFAKMLGENKALNIQRASEIITAVNEYEALCEVAEAATHLTVWGEREQDMYADELTLQAALAKLNAIRGKE